MYLWEPLQKHAVYTCDQISDPGTPGFGFSIDIKYTMRKYDMFAPRSCSPTTMHVVPIRNMVDALRLSPLQERAQWKPDA